MRFVTVALVCIGLAFASCGDDSSPTLQSATSRQDRFGIIDRGQVRQWSALWHMSERGSISFCIRNARSSSETQTLRGYARYAVSSWISRMNQGPPDSSYPAWQRSSVDVSFGCTSGAWTIAMFNGRSNCEYDRKRINLGYGTGREVLTHEFGHAMGLADTYSYRGGNIAGQPVAMMQSGTFSQDDYYGLWALWRFLVTGNFQCGPGYVRAYNGNYQWDLMCKPGQNGGGVTNCKYACSDYGYSEGQCYRGWLCSNGCIEYIGTCSRVANCRYACSDYGFQEGECRNRWKCKNGCLRRVKRCR